MTATRASRRLIIVTGGAGGIGRATCERFAAAGDSVVVADRDEAAAVALAKDLGAGALGVRCDVSSEAEVRRLVETCIERFNKIDVLVNNAGVIDAGGTPMIETSVEAFRGILGVNLTGAWLMAREVGRQMLRQGDGAIVNLASGAGYVATPYRNAYGASKAAIVSLTRTLACEWAGRGIRVNALAPGYIRTDLVEQLISRGKVDPALVERRIPMGRMGRPSEMAEVIFHLASSEASYITGATVVADGGFLAFGGTGPASQGPAAGSSRRGPRTVVVTGAASGIGRSIAKAFVEAGDCVLLFDRNASAVAAVAEALGPGARGIAGDVTDETSVEAMVLEATRVFGGVDVLVNNAGVADGFAPTVNQQMEDFERVLDSDLTGAFIAAKAVAKGMLVTGGAMVNVSSIAAAVGLPRRNAYCAAKAGLNLLTRSLACEWAGAGIRVNAVAPGYVATPGLQALARSGDRKIDRLHRRTPMGRLAEPREIAGVVRFLASDAASYMTGAVVAVDGGWTAFGDSGDAAD